MAADPQPTRPVPCADCGLCRWADHCESVWQAEDSLFNVANMSRGQVKKLEAAGIGTMTALAELDRPVRGIAEGARARLVTQARLQHARKTGAPSFELRAPEPGKGFDLLPAPQPGDLFYDIEGDPHYEGGLEYLHGVWCDGQFRAFWAHDHEAEARALSDLLAFFRARLEAFPAGRCLELSRVRFCLTRQNALARRSAHSKSNAMAPDSRKRERPQAHACPTFMLRLPAHPLLRGAQAQGRDATAALGVAAEPCAGTRTCGRQSGYSR